MDIQDPVLIQTQQIGFPRLQCPRKYVNQESYPVTLYTYSGITWNVANVFSSCARPKLQRTGPAICKATSIRYLNIQERMGYLGTR